MQAKKPNLPSRETGSGAVEGSESSGSYTSGGGAGGAAAGAGGSGDASGQRPPTDATPIRQHKQLASEGL